MSRFLTDYLAEIDAWVRSREPSPPYTPTELATSKSVHPGSSQTFPTVAPPISLRNCTLHNFQRDSLTWLMDRYRRKISCVLADEVRLPQSNAFVFPYIR